MSLMEWTDEQFQQQASQGLVLVDFYADWCGPCKMLSPILQELSIEFAGKVTIAKLNTEKAQKISNLMNITSIPTLIVFKEGKEIQRIVGLKDKQFLSQMLTDCLNAA